MSRMRYDPLIAPDAGAWLALDESERLALVLEAHRRAHVRLPDERVHAALHVIVENQIAESYGSVPATLHRLLAEGLDRHEAVHAIGSVVTTELHGMLQRQQLFDAESYEQALDRLSAAAWRKAFRDE